MRRLAAIAALTFVGALPSPTGAAVTPAMLEAVGVHVPFHAALPLSLRFRDDQGQATTLGDAMAGEPTALVFADYTCTTLCAPALGMTASALANSGERLGRDSRLVVIGLDPRDGPAAARALRSSRLAAYPAVDRAAALLIGDPATITAATRAVGFRYSYDAQTGQFAHPVAVFVLTPQGRVSSVLSEVGLDGRALGSALAGARQGRTGGLIDQLRLICHGVLAPTGVYDRPVQLALRIAGVATVLGIATSLVLLGARRRRGAA